MPIDSDNRRTGLAKRQISSVILASFVLLSQTFSLAAAGAATDSSSKPILKAIDPSQAKMDSLPKPQASTLNPMGTIQGAPISADKPGGVPGGATNYTPYNQPPGGYAQPGYQPVGQPGFQLQGYPQYQQPPGYPAASPGYPPAAAPPGYPPAGGYPNYQAGYPSSPPGYPSYPPTQTPYGYGQAPPGNYGSAYGQPAYGGAQSSPVTSPPGYPTMPPSQPAYPNYNMPPGFVQPGANTSYQRPPQQPQPNSYQQPPQQASQGSFPAGRARLGGGHPNQTPVNAPVQSGPQAQGGSYRAGDFGNSPPTSYQQPPGFAPAQPQGFSQPGYPRQSAPPSYPQQPAYGGAGGGMAPTGQFASNNFPSSNLIPDFGKPLPLDASSRGPAQMWTTNRSVPAPSNYGAAYGAPPGNAPGSDPNEIRVARLEKVAFGSTYPEHEVEDRVDHLEKEIFSKRYTDDLSSRMTRLENKLGGGGSFGSPIRNQSSQYGSYAGGSSPVSQAPPVPVAQSNSISQSDDSTNPNAGLVAQSVPPLDVPLISEKATELTLKSPDDAPTQGTTLPNSSAGTASSGSSDDDDAGTSPMTDGETPDDPVKAPSGSADDDSATPSPDTADGVSTKSGSGKRTGAKTRSTSKSLAMASTVGSESASKNQSLHIPYDKNAGDYADRISRFVNNSAARWTQFPVRVRLPEDATGDWKKLMEPGIEKWGRYVPLKKVTPAEGADIEVSFVNHLIPRVLGVTRLTVTGGHIKVFIFMLRPNYYPSIAEKTLAHAFLHELGHALGIFGHSDKTTDAMSTFEMAGNGKLTQEKLGTLSTRDVNTLKLIYDAAPLPEDFNMTTPQEWGYVHEASCS